jgi:hypothetical protein
MLSVHLSPANRQNLGRALTALLATMRKVEPDRPVSESLATHAPELVVRLSDVARTLSDLRPGDPEYAFDRWHPDNDSERYAKELARLGVGIVNLPTSPPDQADPVAWVAEFFGHLTQVRCPDAFRHQCDYRCGKTLHPAGWENLCAGVERLRADVSGELPRGGQEARPGSPTAAYCCIQTPEGAAIRWAPEKGPVQVCARLSRLLNALLTLDLECAPQERVLEQFGNPDLADKTLRNYLSDLNEPLEAIRFPWSYALKGAHVRRQPA